jgi:acyl-CoA thioester hydrolase
LSQVFRYYLRVRYGECDAQKVVFNARYGDYVDLAVSEFIRAIGYGAQMVSSELDFQLVKQTTEWKAPSRYDDVLECRVATRHIGNTSFTIGVEFRLVGEDLLRASSETVYVMVDRQLGKTPVPPAFRLALEAGAKDRSVDHAALG